MKAYNILVILVVNNDQTNVHLIPIARERILENKKTQHIKALMVENKRQVTLVVSSVASGFLLPPHIMFTSTTPRCLSPCNEGKDKCISLG
jgi:hypothetical protein